MSYFLTASNVPLDELLNSGENLRGYRWTNYCTSHAMPMNLTQQLEIDAPDLRATDQKAKYVSPDLAIWRQRRCRRHWCMLLLGTNHKDRQIVAFPQLVVESIDSLDNQNA